MQNSRMTNEFYMEPRPLTKFLTPFAGMLQHGKISAEKHLKITLKKIVNAFLIELKH